MTPTQIDYLRDLAINNLPRAKADREQINRYGGDTASFYLKLTYTSTMVLSKASTTAIEFSSARMLESVCLLQLTLSKTQRADTLHNLTEAANNLCLHLDLTIAWLAAPPLPEVQPTAIATPALPLPLSIAGTWLSTKKAALVLGVSEQTMRRWASEQSGSIQPDSKIGLRHRWSGDKILEYLEGPKKTISNSSNVHQLHKIRPNR